MALRLSDGFTTALAGAQGYYDVLRNCVFELYSGTQPTTANDAPTGTKLATITVSSGTLTPEVRATALVDFTSATDNCTALTIGGTSLISGAVTYSTPTALAAAVAADINATRTLPDYIAVVGGTAIGATTYGSDAKIVYIIAPKNAGTSLNGLTVACTVAAGSIAINGGSSTTLGGAGATAGVASANGLTFTYPADTKILSKVGTWTGTAVASGTVGWGRFVARNRKTGAADSGAADASSLDMRMDVAVGTSSATAEAVVASTTVAIGATQTVNSFALTIGG